MLPSLTEELDRAAAVLAQATDREVDLTDDDEEEDEQLREPSYAEALAAVQQIKTLFRSEQEWLHFCATVISLPARAPSLAEARHELSWATTATVASLLNGLIGGLLKLSGQMEPANRSKLEPTRRVTFSGFQLFAYRRRRELEAWCSTAPLQSIGATRREE